MGPLKVERAQPAAISCFSAGQLLEGDDMSKPVPLQQTQVATVV